MQKIEVYSRFKKDTVDQLVKTIRSKPLDKTKVAMILEKEVIILSTRPRCLINAHIFNLLAHYKIPLEYRKSFIFNGTYNKGESAKYMTHCFETLRDIDFPHKNILMSHLLADIKSVFIILSIIVNGVVSCDHSIYQYAQCYKSNPEFKKIFTERVFEPDDDPWTIQRKSDAVIDKFKKGEIKLDPLSSFLKYGVKANASQMLMFFCYSLAPNFADVHEVLPPLGVGILNGITDPYHLYVFDMISRLAIMTGKNDVKETGLQSKRLSINQIDSKLSISDTREMIDDCHTHVYFKAKINNKNDLYFFRYKYIYNPETHTRVGYIDIDREDLIGKELFIRTFAACYGEVVCKECYGYNWEMVADTPLYKGNFHLYTLEEFNRLMQTVISIKHHSVALLKKIPCKFGDKTYDNITDFIEQEPYIKKLAFDKLIINRDFDVVFYPAHIKKDDNVKKSRSKRVDLKVKEELYINGIKFETAQKIRKIDDYTYQIVIPNDSPLLQAQALKLAINKHSSKNGDFKYQEMKGKTLSEQIHMIFDYLTSKIKLKHFIYYESIIHALTRDADNPSRRINPETTHILFTHADHALTKPERGSSASHILPHGYINKIINEPKLNSAPTEADILYAGLGGRKILNKNITKKLNACVVFNSPNIIG